MPIAPLVVFFLAAGQEVLRILWTIVQAYFVMKVRSRRSSSGPDQTDVLFPFHFLTNLDQHSGQMTVSSGQPVPMIENNQIAVRSLILGVNDHAIGGSVNLRIVDR